MPFMQTAIVGINLVIPSIDEQTVIRADNLLQR